MKSFRLAALGLGALGVFLAAFVACGDDDDAASTQKPDASAPVTTGTALGDSSPPPPSPDSGDVPDAITPPDSCDGLRYCESFEAYDGPITNAMKLGPWAASVAGVSMAVDTTRAHSGARSLHITTTADAGAPAHGTLRQTATDGGLVPGNDVYGRVMVYYNGDPGYMLPLGVHSWIFNTQGNSVQLDGGAVDLNMGGGGQKMQLNYHFPNETPGEQAVQGGTITTGAWHCIQWQLNGSKDGGGAKAKPADDDKVWLDGQLVVEAVEFADGGGKKWPSAEPWKLFDFGFNHYQYLDSGANQPIEAVDIYLDDFAMNETMIACPQ